MLHSQSSSPPGREYITAIEALAKRNVPASLFRYFASGAGFAGVLLSFFEEVAFVSAFAVLLLLPLFVALLSVVWVFFGVSHMPAATGNVIKAARTLT